MTQDNPTQTEYHSQTTGSSSFPLSRRSAIRGVGVGVLGLAVPFGASGIAQAGGDDDEKKDTDDGKDRDEAFEQTDILFAEDPSFNVEFGIAVSVNEDTAVVGAPAEDVETEDGEAESAGAAYVFTREDGEWDQQARLTASSPQEFAGFGDVVSVSGDTALIGAPFEDRENGELSENAGVAYVFTNDDGDWTQQDRVTGVLQEFSAFGNSVSVSGDTALIGAGGEDIEDGELLENVGAAYVFTNDDGDWTQQDRLTGALQERARFGSSVSVDSETALIGADGEVVETEDEELSGAGAAYVFTDDGGDWTQQDRVTASPPQEFAEFGDAVSVADDTALVGASGEQVETEDEGLKFGAAYVFANEDGNWPQQDKLSGFGNAFGSSVSLTGETALVGAPFEDLETDDGEVLIDAGAAFVFTTDDTDWDLQQELTPGAEDISDPPEFGTAVSLDEATALVGAIGEDFENQETVEDAGAAYVFTETDGSTDGPQGNDTDT